MILIKIINRKDLEVCKDTNSDRDGEWDYENKVGTAATFVAFVLDIKIVFGTVKRGKYEKTNKFEKKYT